MIIKEIEERSGLTRANIRFYEAEGLFTPERRPNGYRDYSEENLETLLRIRLLRSLHISLEEIKALQAGEGSLEATLERHLQALEAEKAEAARAQAVCRVMQGDRAEYATLDARRYLEELARQESAGAWELTQDVIPHVKEPWRRFFARRLDIALCMTLIQLPLMLFGVNILDQDLLIPQIAGTMILMIFLEPLLLSKFKTTPGKAILGLSVTALNGERLTYRAAFSRTWRVAFWGVGLNLPIFSLVRYVRCYYLCQEDRPLPWEEESLITVRDSKYGLRVIAFLAACAAVPIGTWLLYQQAGLPLHRGDLTVKEFSANYNRMLRYHGISTGYRLKSDGTWQKRHTVVWVNDYLFAQESPSELTFTEEDGVLTGVTLHMRRVSWEEDGSGPYDFYGQMEAAVRAFAFAQRDVDPGKYGRLVDSGELFDLIDWTDSGGEEVYSVLPGCGGVKMLCVTAQEGYDTANLARGWLDPEGRAWMEITFTMTTGELPKNQTGITVEQFARRYNEAGYRYNPPMGWFPLEPDGTWGEKITPATMAYLGEKPPALEYLLEEGKVTGVRYHARYQGGGPIIDADKIERRLLIETFVWAQEAYPDYDDHLDSLLGFVEYNPFGSFDWTIAGVKVTGRMRQAGYEVTGMEGVDTLYPLEEKDRSAWVEVTLDIEQAEN